MSTSKQVGPIEGSNYIRNQQCWVHSRRMSPSKTGGLLLRLEKKTININIFLREKPLVAALLIVDDWGMDYWLMDICWGN